MVATTAERVAIHTSPRSTARIWECTDSRIRYLRAHPEAIPARLREIDEEWDIERTLETGSASLTLLGLLVGSTFNRKWLLLSIVVQGFFLQHALQGWCPPLPVLRRLGVRTTQEIEAERHALLEILDRRGPPEPVEAGAPFAS